MPDAARSEDDQDLRIVLGLLESVERDGAQSQRKLAAELGIALGLVNAYLKRCATKGLVKVRSIPTRRYAYYLTPKGFAEKSRLTVDYFSSSFSFFRQARADCSATLKIATTYGWKRAALLGVSDLAEIAAICALETRTKIVAVVDPKSMLSTFVGVPVRTSWDDIGDQVDCVIVTDIKTANETVNAAIKKFGHNRVLVPALLGVRINDSRGASK
jgi:DNA-binding MarR family transcriptional regulator